MCFIRRLLLILLIAAAAMALGTAIRPVLWTGRYTAVVFGRGGIKINHKTLVYPGESATYEHGKPSTGWFPLRSSNYTFRYFLLPAFNRTDRELRIILPHWLILAAFAAPWLFLRRQARQQAQRARTGACPNCGYDLKGNESGTCPECGHRREQLA